MGKEVAKYCEMEYLHPKERFIQMDRKWWITAVDGWCQLPGPIDLWGSRSMRPTVGAGASGNSARRISQ